MLRKILPVLLTAVQLLSAVSCTSKSKAENTYKTASADEDPAISEIAEDNSLSDGLGEFDWEGKEFSIGAAIGYGVYVSAEEDSGDIVISEMFRRNSRIEERFNVSINVYETGKDSNELVKQCYAEALSGDSSYSAVIGNGTWLADELSPENAAAFLDFNSLPYLNYDKPWWNSNEIKDLSVNNRMYVGFPMITYHNISGAMVVIINSEIAADWGIEIPYAKVADGLWTLDELKAMVKDVYSDVNGNGRKDDSDIYGFSTYVAKECWAGSFKATTVVKDSNGLLAIDIEHERIISSIEKLYDFYFSQNGVYPTCSKTHHQGDWGKSNEMFDSGRVMASVRTMSEIGSVIRYTDIDYNILPIPKFDANQKDYYCNVDTHCGVMLPAMNADTNFVGMMIEAMCCGTYNNVLRAYYEITLKEKLLQNRNDAAMLDIIQSSAQMWRDQIYVTQITQALPQILMEESMDFESYSAKNLSVSEKQIENWNAIFTNQ